MRVVALEARIVDALDRWATFQKLSDSERALVLVLDADCQCFHSAMKQKCRMRVERTAKMVEAMLHLVHQFPPADDGARNDIRMSVQILCATVEREIKTRFSWTEIDRAGKCVIDQRH